MASFDVTLKNAKFIGLVSGQKFQVLAGEVFTVDLVGWTGEHRWSTFQDKLLEMDEKQLSTKVKAVEKGETEIQVQTLARVIDSYLTVEIVDSFPEPAVDLGGTVTVRPKT